MIVPNGAKVPFPVIGQANGITLTGGDTATVTAAGVYELNVTVSAATGPSDFRYLVDGNPGGTLPSATTTRLLPLAAGDLVTVVNQEGIAVNVAAGATLELIGSRVPSPDSRELEALAVVPD